MNDEPPVRDLSKSHRDRFFEHFSKELEEEMGRKAEGLQKITQKKFHDFEFTKFVKSDTKVKIDSHEKFSRKELEQKELILKELTKKLQQKLTSYEKNKDEQKLLLKEEEQKKIISKELNQILSTNYKKETLELLHVLSNKMNMSIVPAINTINQILKTGIIDEDKKEPLEIIKTSLYEFLDDASRIAEYQRLVQGDESIHKTIIDPNKMIEKILTKQKIDADKKGIKIIFENHDAETIFCDEYRISFILNNLISNSINLCQKDSQIKIIVNSNQKQGSVSIVDTGKGFSPGFIDEIFSNKIITDPFVKENQIKTSMVISRIIIDNHGGEFSIISRPGQKTEISFTLPSRIIFSNKPK